MYIWIIFISAILVFLFLDLGVFNRHAHTIEPKEAGIWTAIWVTLSFVFAGVIHWLYYNNMLENSENLSASQATMKFISGYLIELSLSVDNIFVIAVIFTSFGIPSKYQHRVLFWGIIGAIIFRGLMIFFGVMIINKFDWMMYFFGAFLIFTAIKLLTTDHSDEFDPKKSIIFRLIDRIIPVTMHLNGEKFFISDNKNRTVATPLFITLIVIEVTDIFFAVDSVPAILAITKDPFIVFSSNIFAILGLRSMYFFLANLLAKFKALEYSLVAILIFVGLKMLLHSKIHLPEWVSLSFIALALAAGILVSLLRQPKVKDSHHH